MDAPTRVEAALAALAEARDQRDRAEETFQAARDGVGEALRVLGLNCLIDGTLPPISLLRELYWQCPEVRVADIGRAFALKASEVHSLAGPGFITDHCFECGVEVRRQVKSRSAGATARSGRWRPHAYTDWRICENCRPGAIARQEEANELRRRQQEAEDREYEQRLEEARRAGKVRRLVVEEVDGIPSSWTLLGALTEDQ